MNILKWPSILRVPVLLGGVLAVILVVWWCALYFLQDRLLYAASMAPKPMSAKPMFAKAQVLELGLDDGDHVEAWFIPALSATGHSPSPVVVFFHGNAELIDYQDLIVDGYQNMGCAVLLVEYRGYGRSGGKPSQEAIRADTLAFLDQLSHRRDIDLTKLIFHGRSLGGAVAADAASFHKPAALVLESTFCSLESMAAKLAAPAFLIKNPYRTEEVVREIQVPTLVFHGSRDEIVPVSHGRALSKACRDVDYEEFPCGHNDLPGPGQIKAYWTHIQSFLSKRGLL